MTRRGAWAALLLAALFHAQLQAAPRVAIIVDDLGYRLNEGLRATRLPGPVACAVIPNAPHARSMAQAAHAQGKEVLVHLPMQSIDPARPVGGDGITLETTRDGIQRLVRAGLAAVPHARGMNNHMGSLITRHPGHMTWLMQALAHEGLFFVDSVTTGDSVALSMAREQGVPALARDLFLDREDMAEAEIEARLDRLLALARRRGHAVGIAHPYPATMAVLERRLRSLEASDIELVPVATLVTATTARPVRTTLD